MKQETVLEQQQRQEKWTLGWGTCNAKGKMLMSQPLNFLKIYFPPLISLYL